MTEKSQNKVDTLWSDRNLFRQNIRPNNLPNILPKCFRQDLAISGEESNIRFQSNIWHFSTGCPTVSVTTLIAYFLAIIDYHEISF